MIVCPVKDYHTVRSKVKVFQKFLIVLFSFADLYKFGRITVSIYHHVDFQAAFLLAFVLRVASYTFHYI